MTRKEIIAALKAGDKITVTLPKSGTCERKQFTLLQCGKAVRASQFRDLLNDLRPLNDGLFGFSQTYEWGGA